MQMINVMKKRLHPFILTITFLLTAHTFAQDAVYEFNEKHTKTKANRYKSTPEIYSVTEQKLAYTIKPKIKIETDEYKSITSEINSILNDSISINTAYNNSLQKVKELKRISQLINTFIANPKPFEVKKHYLIEAQTLASKHNLNELIYADDLINPEKKTKFRLLKIDKIDLKVQLKKAVWKCNTTVKNIVAPINPSKINSQMAVLRKKQLHTKRYTYTIGSDKEVFKNGLAISSKINDISSITGNYNSVNKFYIMKSTYGKFVQNELVSKSDIMKYGIPKRFLKDEERKVLLKNIDTGELVIADDHYVKKYVFKINGQFQYNTIENIATSEN